MKPDIDIKDDLYQVLKGSALATAVSGVLRKTLRPEYSNREDIVISIIASNAAEWQEAFVRVNIYVPAIVRDGQAEEDSARLRTLCRLAADLLKSGYGDDFHYRLVEQRVLKVDGRDEYVIYNKVLYEHLND